PAPAVRPSPPCSLPAMPPRPPCSAPSLPDWVPAVRPSPCEPSWPPWAPAWPPWLPWVPAVCAPDSEPPPLCPDGGRDAPGDGDGVPDDGDGRPPGDGWPDEGDGIPADGDGMPDDGEGMPDEGDGMPPLGDGMPPLGECMPDDGAGIPPLGIPLCGPDIDDWLAHAARPAALPATRISWIHLLRIAHLGRCREAATSAIVSATNISDPARPGSSADARADRPRPKIRESIASRRARGTNCAKR